MLKLLVGGFLELTPDKQILENNIKNIIRSNYEIFGFVNIETPSVEFNNVLISKSGEETIKQIYGIYGLKQGGDDLKKFSLHFDLTVPLARYIVDNENELFFPFKRYQIQKAWRGERQQKGRFKEFIQCDIDIIGNNISLNYDIEIIHVLYNTLKEIFNFLEINKGIEIHLNNRKFIDGLCVYFDIKGDYKNKFYILLDRFYKISMEEFENSLKEIVGNRFNELLKILSSDINDLIFDNQDLNNTFLEIKEIYLKLKKKGVNVIFDPYITRGLNYYTGIVFETFISDYFNIGSICSGGRYDGLVSDIRKLVNSKGINYGGVGGSIGLTRLMSIFNDNTFLNKKLSLTQTIIFNIPGNNQEYREKVGNILRKAGFSSDIYYESNKLEKQFTYADLKNISFGIFAGKDEEFLESVIVKNLYTRESETIKLDNLIEYIRSQLDK